MKEVCVCVSNESHYTCICDLGTINARNCGRYMYTLKYNIVIVVSSFNHLLVIFVVSLGSEY